MSELLGRTLGETIQVETKVQASLWAASADPGQVENALLNLALNARDAMPNGGKLTIECANARLDEAYKAENPEAVAGDYVVLTVHDTGTGMSDEVRARAFEPFFTTKEVGQGSGLGLSMVYGFAKQSGGHVAICSEEEQGTTVRLYLPRGERATVYENASQQRETPLGQGETVLVIEDDPGVREAAGRILEELDYQVTLVADAAAADEALSNGGAVDLLLSDVVLPGGTSGPEFAEQARKRCPDLRVVFMSGYPAQVAGRAGFLDGDTVLINKPFRRQELAKALRDALV